MAQIIQEISVEVAKPNLFQALVAKQGDYGSRFLKVTFVNNGEKLTINATSTVTINANRPDGGSKRFEGVVNDDNTVTVPLAAWILELDGEVRCDISVMDAAGEKKLTSTSFTVKVDLGACSDTDISEDEDYDILKQAVETAVDAAERAEKAAEVVNDCFFYAEYGVTTYAEIKEAYEAGRGVYVKMSAGGVTNEVKIGCLVVVTDEYAGFDAKRGNGDPYDLRCYADNTWVEILREMRPLYVEYGGVTAYAEITNALSKGRAVVVKRTLDAGDTIYYTLVAQHTSTPPLGYVFTCTDYIDGTFTTAYCAINDANEWTGTDV